MAASPQWFGPSDRRLFGWVHLPAPAPGEPGETAPDVARGLVVVCPSMGQEAVFGHFPLRSVADQLAADGFVVVRLDYDGTGDSHGDYEDADRLGAWLDSIDAAVALGRHHTEAPLTLIGFRLGALLAVAAADRRGDVAGLVLWDSPRSGRSFLRERAIQQNVSVGGADLQTATFTALGLSVTVETQAQLRTLDVRSYQALPADRVLSLDRSGRPGPGPTVTTRDGSPVDRVEAADQDDLLFRQSLPVVTEARLVAWLDEAFSARTHAVRREPAPGSSTSAPFPGGVERVVRIGDAGLFGILTEPVAPSAEVTAVFVPDSFTPHSGLSRIWTDLARAWAAAGIRSLRFDVNGCADSDPRPGEPEHTVGLLSHLQDTTDALRFAGDGDPGRTIAIGLCSGGYLSLEAALAVRPRGIALINPITSFITAERSPDRRRRAIIVTRWLPRKIAGRPAGRVAERLSHTNKIPAFMMDPNFEWNRVFEACFWKDFLVNAAWRMPDWLWRVVNRVLATQQPDDVYGAIRDRGVDVLLIGGDPDFQKATLGARRQMARLERRGGLRMVHQPGLDHAMMRPGTKDDVARELTGYVTELAGVSGAARARLGA